MTKLKTHPNLTYLVFENNLYIIRLMIKKSKTKKQNQHAKTSSYIF